MKKKIIAIIAIVCVTAFALAACGGNSGGGNNGGGDNGGGSTAGASTFDVGAFTVDVPSGWTAFKQVDMFAEKDADGNYPVDPEQIFIAKAADELSALSNPNVRIYYHNPNTTVMDSRDFYDNVKDLEGVSINGTECTGFQGESIGYVYQNITYNAGDAIYEIQILVSAEGKDTGITWESPEVQTILNSIKAK